MPHIVKAQNFGEDNRAVLTDRERALVHGMNKSAFGFGNITALHFDGWVLAEMVYAHRQLEESKLMR